MICPEDYKRYSDFQRNKTRNIEYDEKNIISKKYIVEITFRWY